LHIKDKTLDCRALTKGRIGRMDKMRQERYWTPAFCLMVAGLSLCQGGCLLVAAGAAGGAAAGYAYYRGKVTQAYCANLEDTSAAVHAALNELGMAIVSEEKSGTGGCIKTQTGDGDRVRIQLAVVPSKFPAEGPLTEVSVRVRAFGDHPVSERILCQVGYHLVPAPALNPPPPSPSQVPPASLIAPQSGEPPLTSSQGPFLPNQPVPATGK
jgi:hypothetical protein